LNGLERLGPIAGATDPRLMPLYDRAGSALASECERPPLAAPEDALLLVRCIEAWHAHVPTPAFDMRAQAARQKSALWLDAQAAERTAQPGMAWLYESLAACLGGRNAYGPRAQSYRSRFDDAHLVRVQLTARSGVEASAACTQLQQQLPLRCASGADALRAEVDASLGALTDSPIRERKSVEVLDHTERWANPAYQSALESLRHAQHRHRQAQDAASLGEADCNTARQALSRANSCSNCSERTYEESVCNRKGALEDIASRERRSVRDAESTVNNTPEYNSRDVYRSVYYLETQHRFQIPWRVRVTVGEASTDRSSAFSYESLEREGVPAAGLTYLAYAPPRPATVQSALAAQATEVLTGALTAEVDRRANAKLSSCPNASEWNECTLEVAVLRRADPIKGFVEFIGARVDARSSGWPAAACVD
jgi:hypothetical protein